MVTEVQGWESAVGWLSTPLVSKLFLNSFVTSRTQKSLFKLSTRSPNFSLLSSILSRLQPFHHIQLVLFGRSSWLPFEFILDFFKNSFRYTVLLQGFWPSSSNVLCDAATESYTVHAAISSVHLHTCQHHQKSCSTHAWFTINDPL